MIIVIYISIFVCRMSLTGLHFYLSSIYDTFIHEESEHHRNSCYHYRYYYTTIFNTSKCNAYILMIIIIM